MERSMHSSSQLPVRACMLLLVALAYLAEDLGLDVILGAFAAGMVVRLATGGGNAVLESKLEAIGFGFLVPVFFIVSGMRFDLDGLVSDPAAAVLVPVFLVALLFVRGAPALLYARVLVGRDRAALALLSSTSLPLIVADHGDRRGRRADGDGHGGGARRRRDALRPALPAAGARRARPAASRPAPTWRPRCRSGMI